MQLILSIFGTKLAKPRIKPKTSCIKVMYAADSAHTAKKKKIAKLKGKGKVKFSMQTQWRCYALLLTKHDGLFLRNSFFLIIIIFTSFRRYNRLFLVLFCDLTLSQTTNFGLFQSERVCRRQFQFWWKWQKNPQKGRKHCGKRRNCSLGAISPFPTLFSKELFCYSADT